MYYSDLYNFNRNSHLTIGVGAGCNAVSTQS
jgi:hypothetical protein